MKIKKGFTLIELLAVILILGLIALIAIPVVTAIIREAKKNAFKTGVQSIVNTIEQQCQLDRLNDRTITTIYTFTDGVVTPVLNLKGQLPNAGTVSLNDDCIVTSINLSNYEYTAVLNGDIISIVDGTISKYDEYVIGQEITLKDGSRWIIIDDSNGDNPIIRMMSPLNIFDNLDDYPNNDIYISNSNSTNYTLAYSLSASNIWNNSTLKKYLDETVKTKLEEKLNLTIDDITIIGIEDLKRLDCTVTGDETTGVTAITCNSNTSWHSKIFGITNSWLRVPSASNSMHVWIVKQDGTFTIAAAHDTSTCGVRPIISVLKDNI